MKSIPDINWPEPKVNRGTPVIVSIPIVAMNKPNETPMNPFTRFPALREATTVSPISARAKYSGEENLRANDARRGVRKIKTIVPNTPPVAELNMEMPSAFPLRLF